MLTKSEKKWLGERELTRALIGCYRLGDYSLDPDYKDAAIFAERVALELAFGAHQPCAYGEPCPFELPDRCNWATAGSARCNLFLMGQYVEKQMAEEADPYE